MKASEAQNEVVALLRASRTDRMGASVEQRLGYAIRVRTIRLKKERTQRYIGERMGVSQAVINQIEAGRYSPTRGVSDRLALALDVDPEWLWTGEPANVG